MSEASSPEQVRKLYDSSASSYDKMMDAEMDQPVYADTLSRLATRIESLDGIVVDTSCGSGHMLQMFRHYDTVHPLQGVDLSPRMVEIAADRLGDGAGIVAGDMCDLPHVAEGSAAAVISFFALHHLSSSQITPALGEWWRILGAGGQLVLAAWEGEGPIDYPEQFDLKAFHYTQGQIEAWARGVGFRIDRSVVETVPDMGMDAVYLEATKPA